jgi:hypothetical protein
MVLALSGCTVLLKPGESQCETVADCEARGFKGAVCTDGVCEKATVVDPVWGCLGHVVEPTPDPSKNVQFDVPIRNALDSSPVTNVVVDLCDKLDLDCTGTNPAFPKGLMPDANGIMHLSIFQGFDGFVRLTSPDFMDSRIFPGRPIVAPLAIKEVRLLTPSLYQATAAIAKETVDPTRGTAIIYAVDCGGKAASGVRFEDADVDSASLQFYLINMAPTPTAKHTDVDGFGGIFNLPATITAVQAYRDADNTYIGQSAFQILANTISYVLVAPTPN